MQAVGMSSTKSPVRPVEAKYSGAESLARYNSQYGPNFQHLVLTVYANFFSSELEIMGLCGRWIPRRLNLIEKGYLIKHASDEVDHADLFRKGVERLGITWSDELLNAYRVNDIDDRFASLHRAEDELRVLIGLNCYAEGVLAMEELIQLGDRYADIFPDFDRIARDEFTHVAFGRSVLRRLLAEDPSRRRQAQVLVDEYRDHLLTYLWDELGEKIDFGIQYGALSNNYRENTLHRFDEVMRSAGLQVEWPTDRKPVAPEYLRKDLIIPRTGA